jgi:hypothetical protein
MNYLRLLLSLVIIFTFGYLGLERGYEESERINRGGDVPWKRVGLPEERKAEIFVIGSPPWVAFRTTGGELLGRKLGATDGGEWHEISDLDLVTESFPETYYASCGGKSGFLEHQLIPQPPGDVVSSVDCEIIPHAEAKDAIRYIFVEDGSMWSWGMSTSMTSGFGHLFNSILYSLMFAVGGVTIGVGIAFGLLLFERIFTLLIQGASGLIKLERSV